MTSIGETLRRERQKLKLDLDQVSRELKIAPRFLEAIEDEHFDRLPGGVFAKSFVRQYARMLGLDEEEAADEVERAIAPPPPELEAPEEKPRAAAQEIHVPRMEAWESIGDRKHRWLSPLSSLALVVLAMFGCSLIYGWWQHSRRERALGPTSHVAHRTAVPPQPQPQQQTPRPTDNPSVAQPQTGTAPIAPETPNPTTDDAAAAGNVKVQLVASEPVWVMVQTDGKYSFSGILSPNETRTVEANETVTLRLGNAGGISITLNGKPIGNVGPKGQVRTVQLTSGGFQVVAAPKPLAPL